MQSPFGLDYYIRHWFWKFFCVMPLLFFSLVVWYLIIDMISAREIKFLINCKFSSNLVLIFWKSRMWCFDWSYFTLWEMINLASQLLLVMAEYLSQPNFWAIEYVTQIILIPFLCHLTACAKSALQASFRDLKWLV